MALSVAAKTIGSEDALVDILTVAQIGRKLESTRHRIDATDEGASIFAWIAGILHRNTPGSAGSIGLEHPRGIGLGCDMCQLGEQAGQDNHGNNWEPAHA
ncbi:hypothetical protein [Labrys sp. WJW]|uniref:hypothetical protein n=1 Tax=Labrys sp. WJW TaxID=1737983 RepID=UPI0012EA14E0|nr:hypothetical protein [Labrys sp. WJW]